MNFEVGVLLRAAINKWELHYTVTKVLWLLWAEHKGVPRWRAKWKCSIKHVWDCTIEQSLHFTSSYIRVMGGVLLAQSTIISWFLLGGKDSERLLIIFQPEGHFFPEMTVNLIIVVQFTDLHELISLWHMVKNQTKIVALLMVFSKCIQKC